MIFEVEMSGSRQTMKFSVESCSVCGEPHTIIIGYYTVPIYGETTWPAASHEPESHDLYAWCPNRRGSTMIVSVPLPEHATGASVEEVI